MTPTLRDAMAAARINRLKTRVAKSWAARQIQADLLECQCLGCKLQRTMLRVANLSGDDEPKAPASASHLN